jgi:endonuclease/exonuclease/phosphatase family metal-dependent hydrolase
MAHKLSLALVVVTAGAGLSACAVPSDTFIAPENAVECDGAAIDGAEPTGLRVVTWNIRATLSSDIDTIGDVLEGLDADVIALQEVDREAERSGLIDQAATLADRFAMDHAYAAARTEGSGDFGVALLSRLPFVDAKRLELPGSNAFEPRVAIDSHVCVDGRPLRTLTTHADIAPWAGAENTRFIADQVKDSAGQGVVVAGDLNAGPTDEQVENFTDNGLVDAFLGFGAGPTFGSRRIDYVLTDAKEAVLDGRVPESDDASDHRPLLIDLEMP